MAALRIVIGCFLIAFMTVAVSPLLAQEQPVTVTPITPLSQSSGNLPNCLRYSLAFGPSKISLSILNGTGNLVQPPIRFWLGLLNKEKRLLDIIVLDLNEPLTPGQRSLPIEYSTMSQRNAGFYKLIQWGDNQVSPDLPQIEFKLTEPKGAAGLSYAATEMDIRFRIIPEEIGFSLLNLTDAPMLVHWDESAYVDQSGRSHRVIHLGVRYIDRDKPMVPSIVPPKTRLEDIVYPTSHVLYTSTGWDRKALYVDTETTPFEVGVFLTLEIKGQKRRLNFRFRAEMEWPQEMKVMFSR